MGPRFQQKHTHIRKGLFRGTINTYAKNSSHLSTTVWTFGLLCGKVQRSRLRLVITWFQGRSMSDLMLVLRCQFFLEYLHERLYKYALEYLEASHSENTLAQVVIFFFLP